MSSFINSIGNAYDYFAIPKSWLIAENNKQSNRINFILQETKKNTFVKDRCVQYCKPDKEFKAKLIDFFKEHGIDEKIKFIVENTDMPVGVYSALDKNYSSILFFSREYYSKIYLSEELSWGLKGVLMHEIGHLRLQHAQKHLKICKRFDLATSIISSAGLTLGIVSSLSLGLGMTHPISLIGWSIGSMRMVVPLVYNSIIANEIIKWHEREADEFSAKESQLCQGQIDLYKANQLDNLKLRESTLCVLENAFSSNNNITKQHIESALTVLNSIDEEGNYLSDLQHPSFSQRIEFFKKKQAFFQECKEI